MLQLSTDYKPGALAPDHRTLYKSAGMALLDKFKFGKRIFGFFPYAERVKPQAEKEKAPKKYTISVSKDTFTAIVDKACVLLGNKPIGKAIAFDIEGNSYYAWLKVKQMTPEINMVKLQLIRHKNKKIGEGGFGKVTRAVKMNSGAKLAVKQMKVAKNIKNSPAMGRQCATWPLNNPQKKRREGPFTEVLVKPKGKNSAPQLSVLEISNKMRQLLKEMEAKQPEIKEKLLEENRNSGRTEAEKAERAALIEKVFTLPVPLLRSKGYLEISEGQDIKQMLLMPRAGLSLWEHVEEENLSALAPYRSESRYRLSVYILLALTLLDACGWGHGDIKESNFLIDRKWDLYLSDLDTIFRLPVADEPPPQSRIGAHTNQYLDPDNCKKLKMAFTGADYAKWYKQRDRIAAARTIFSVITGEDFCFEEDDKDKKIRRTAKEQDLNLKTMTPEMKKCLLKMMNGDEIDLAEACLLFAKAAGI